MTSSTSLYSSTPGNANVASQNFTTLYSGSGTINPQQAYGNANVVALLATSTDGGNTIGNISATGNVTADYFIGNFQGNITGNINVTGSNTEVLFNNAGNVGTAAGFTFVNTSGNLNVSGNVVTGNVNTPTVFSQGLVNQGYDFVQMQYSNAVALPVTPYDIGVGSWFYLDAGGGVFQSNTTGTLQTVVQGNDGSVSATGNVTAPYYFGNGSQLTGIGSTYSNANVVSLLASFGSNVISTTGNITGGFILGNGSQLTGIAAGYSNANVTSLLASFGSNVISTTGNITGGFILGNGSQLTGLPATYSNANVTSLLASFGSNTISTTGNITAGYFVGNGSLLTSLTGANVTGTVANATYAVNSNAATYAGTVTTNAQPNITSVGILTAINTSGAISATGNIQGNVFIGNGAGLTNIPAGNIVGAYGNANVAANLAAFANNPISTSGNITAGYFFGNGSGLTDINAANIVGAYGNANVANFLGNGFGSNTITTTGNITTGNLLTGGVVSATGNVTGANINSAVFQAVNSAGGALRNASGSNQLQWGGGGGNNLTVDVAINISPANAVVTVSPTGTGYVTMAPTTTGSINNMVIGNVTPAAVTATTLSASGNITGGNIQTGGLITATGNITGNVFTGNGAGLTNITGANVTGTVGLAQYVTQNAQANITSVGTLTGLSVSGNTTSGNLLTGGLISATANITGGNLITTGLLSVAGNTTGANLFSYYSTVANSSCIVTNSTVSSNVNVQGINPFRWTVGSGFSGDYGINADPLLINRGSQMAVIGTQNLSNADAIATARLFSSTQFINLQGGANVTATTKRWSALGGYTQLGNGNITTTVTSGFNPGSILNGGASALVVGNQGNVNLGNAYVSHAAATNTSLLAGGGGNIGNAAGYAGTLQTQIANSVFSTSMIGFVPQFQGTSGTTAGNVIGFYMPSNVVTYGWNSTNLHRAATNYYAFKNDDAVAQVQLGSLRAFHQYQYPTATTGTVNINKTNGQVQYIAPTGNITIGSLTNFVTNANDGTNNDAQTDTVTLIITQGATPYTVTMPTGNAAIKYAGNLTTVGSTANSVTMISITAANVSGAAMYMTTISPEFV